MNERSTSRFSAIGRHILATALAIGAIATFGTGCAASGPGDEGDVELGEAKGAMGAPTSSWNGSCTVYVGGTGYAMASATSAYQCAYAGWWANGDSGGFASPCNKFGWACATN